VVEVLRAVLQIAWRKRVAPRGSSIAPIPGKDEQQERHPRRNDYDSGDRIFKKVANCELTEAIRDRAHAMAILRSRDGLAHGICHDSDVVGSGLGGISRDFGSIGRSLDGVSRGSQHFRNGLLLSINERLSNLGLVVLSRASFSFPLLYYIFGEDNGNVRFGLGDLSRRHCRDYGRCGNS
jgi:hypothetical protein